ncbi:MAG: antibiotic biosynthesis monooxygenase family protein [Myxococcaceae bacterium]
MFARNVHLQLKPNTATQFTTTLERDVLPLLRKQPGFQEEVAFIGPNPNEAYAISFWESKEKAEQYGRTVYPEVMKTLASVVTGTPQLLVYEVCSSTIPKITARA